MNELDLDGFTRYCKNINFVRSIGSYKNYLKNGIGVLEKISNDSLQDFIGKVALDNQYLKEDFTQYIQSNKLHIDLYSDFKSAGKKYIEFLASKNITYWLIPSNQSHYDAIGAFKKFKIIDWEMDKIMVLKRMILFIFMVLNLLERLLLKRK